MGICKSVYKKKRSLSGILLISFTENQVTPFNFTTPDHEIIYAWHVMPLGLYAKHEAQILQQPPGCADDITKTMAFQLLRDDPDSKLIINCGHSVSSAQYSLMISSSRRMLKPLEFHPYSANQIPRMLGMSLKDGAQTRTVL